MKYSNGTVQAAGLFGSLMESQSRFQWDSNPYALLLLLHKRRLALYLSFIFHMPEFVPCILKEMLA